ncbi:hypothetical protein CQW23_15564 [Capsicum baccatum]|uniref:BURP domain-containing protein n=1 Tax=Capsicum baccatum TaxID=33114 RepID=A0A2G2WME4_CAPBA|nr:hypothetical protein CQW23_15564 [Capsicum baccatum]
MATSYWFMFSFLSVLSFFAACTSNSIPYAGSNQLKFWKENVVNEMPLALVSKLSPMNKIDSEYYTSLVSKKTFSFDAQSCLVADMFCTSQTDALAKYYATRIPDQAKYYATGIPDQAKYYPLKIPDQAKYYATGIPDQAKYYPSKILDQAKYYATRILDQAKYYPSKIPDQAKYYATRILDQAKYYPSKIPDQAKYYATRIPDQAKYYPSKIPDQAKYYATRIPDQAKYYPSKIPDQAKYYATRIPDQAKYYPSKIPDQAKYYATRIPDQAKYYPSKIPDQAKYYATRIPDQAKYYPSKIPDQAKYYATRIPDQAKYYPSKIPDQAKYYATRIPDQAKYYPTKIPDQAKYYAATRIPDQAKYYPSKIPDQAKYYATSHSNHHLGEVSFFRVSILKPGNTVHLDNLENPFPHRSFLPSQIASKIPINSNHLQHLFPETFSSPFTKDTTQTTIQSCNAPNLKGEVKKCAKSLEEMIEFSKTILKKNHLTALTTKSTEGSGKKLKIDKFHKINAQKSVSCHEIFLPFATYICHLLSSTNIYSVDLVDLKTDAHVNTALVVCHMDTSSWPADHAAFKMLNFSPGKGEACHWMSQSDLIWVGDDVHA